MAFSSPVRPARDPRDTYMLYVLPTTGPIVGVAIDMVAVSHAGAMNPRDTLTAEVNEIIRQLAEQPDLRKVDLYRNRAQLTEMRRYMGRMTRASGMVYSAPGVTPDPFAEAKAEVKKLQAEFAQKLQGEREQAERAKAVAVEYQRKQDEIEREAFRRQFDDIYARASTQRDDAIRATAEATRALKEAQERARAMAAAPSAADLPEESRRAYEDNIAQLQEDVERQKQKLERLETARAEQDAIIDDLAAKNAEFIALRAQANARERQQREQREAQAAQAAQQAMMEAPDSASAPLEEKRGTL